jgi:hypothetical protein
MRRTCVRKKLVFLSLQTADCARSIFSLTSSERCDSSDPRTGVVVQVYGALSLLGITLGHKQGVLCVLTVSKTNTQQPFIIDCNTPGC